MEDAHSSVSPLLRTPVAAPALLATTCVVTACLAKVSFTNTYSPAVNIGFSMTLTKIDIFDNFLYPLL